MSSLLLEKVQIVPGFAPISMTAARTGDVVSLKNYRRCLVLFFKGIGTDGQDPTLTLLQGTDVAFGTNKALTFTTIYKKEDLTSLADVGQWTKVTQSAANTYTHTDAAQSEALWAIDVSADDLDSANGYDCLRASVNDVGTNSQIGCILYLLHEPVTQAAPENMASAIAN
jgi:hypothetical protein